MKISVKETVLFAMYGALMYSTKLIMEILPNIHLVGVFIIALTVVYRKKALYPIYTYIFIDGIVAGFAMWWLPYLYIWTLLWVFTMLIPKKLPKVIRPIVYMTVCSLHGFLFGVLYAPSQALFFGLDFEGMVAWIITGMPFDIIHGISNFFCGMLICPIIAFVKNSDKLVKSH